MDESHSETRPCDSIREDAGAQGLDYDVVVVGGSISGAATALMLAQSNADLKILIVEGSASLGRRVGESTVELSTFFLTRTLGLTRYLNQTQVTKQGFRFWFNNQDVRCMSSSTEMGGRYHSRVGSFQLDREEVDAEVLRRAVKCGAELWRPARVMDFDFVEGGTQTLKVRVDGEPRTVRTRWVVDASGRRAVTARKRDAWQRVQGQQTASVWARFRGTLDFDSPELMAEHPALRRGFFGTRHTATNHLMGDGWWAWIIPLKNGDTSIGVTWDPRFYTFPGRGPGRETLGQRLVSVMESHAVGRRVVAGAELIEGDVHTLRNLAYTCTDAAGDGVVQVGDAAGFIDPFYSMGLDALAITATSAVGLIGQERAGGGVREALAKHNAMLRDSYGNWFEAIYENKYAYMGDFELMRIAFLNDIGLYYLGIVMPPYRRDGQAIADGMFHTTPSKPFFWFIRGVNRRLAVIAADRRRRGTFGRHNAGRRMLVSGFAFDGSLARAGWKVLWLMAKLEVTEGWRTWWRRPTVAPAQTRAGGAGAPDASTPDAGEPDPVQMETALS